MKAFTQLFFELDRTTRTSERLAALQRYFTTADPIDAAWAVYVFAGMKIAKAIPSRRFRQWAAEESGQPIWMVDTCYVQVGDLSETISLLVPHATNGADAPPLHEVVEQVIIPLGKSSEPEQRRLITSMWKRLTAEQCLVVHKLLGGSFRVGVSRQTLVNALAAAAGVEPAVIAHRLAGQWRPDARTMSRILAPAGSSEEATAGNLPYPFMLAHALLDPPDSLGEIGQWLLEWKWDGARCQIIRRSEKVDLWSRGDELLTSAFPEIVDAGRSLPIGTVLDGEIVAWENDSPIPAAFQRLQRRLNRINVEPTFWPDTPVIFVAFDLLEWKGQDIRSKPLDERRSLLAECLQTTNCHSMLRASPPVQAENWTAASELIETSRERGVEGLMLKRLDSTYEPGRPTGLWWKLKITPHSLDCVLIAAEPGHGKRAGLLTDYTFGVWNNGLLVPIAKAYSGLTDEEIREMDRFIRSHTVEKKGPVHLVEPTRVLEIAFEAIMRSTRHKSGIAVRFPRMLRIRWDRKPESADTLERAQSVLATSEAIR